MELKTKIKETLIDERKRKLNESFNEIKDIPDKSLIVERYITISGKLLDEGYTIEEIESTDVSKSVGKVNYGKALTSGLGSTAKEYAIRFFAVSIFGMNPDFASTLSIVLAEASPLDILRLFKNEESCLQGFPNISDGILEAIIRYIGGKKFGTNRNDYKLKTPKTDDEETSKLNLRGMGSKYAGNIFGEIIGQSNISELLANRFCKMIH